MHDTYLKRLAFIKYLFQIGLNQSQQPEPLCGVSILSFHDSIELFLQLSLEKLNISKSDIKFMEYWDFIDNKLKEKKTFLSQKESMKRLNKARVDLKHYGIIPSKLDIESFRASSRAFFDDNCLIIFNISFNDLSIIDLIKFERSRDYLKKAKESFEKNLIDEARQDLALAFEYLIMDYENSKITKFNDSPFFFGESMSFLNSFFMGIKDDRELKKFVDAVSKSIESIQKAIKIISLGIDYKRYVKYRLIVPKVNFFLGGKHGFHDNGPKSLSREDMESSINFIVESALKIQEFDF